MSLEGEEPAVQEDGTGTSRPLTRSEALAAYEATGYDLSSHPAHMIRRAHQRATACFQQVFAGQELTPTQFAVLATLLKMGELSQNQLGRLTAMDPSTISIVVRKLLGTGMIQRRATKKDQRLAMIKLTDQGTRYALDRLADSMEVARRTLAPLSEEERATLLALLQKMGDGDETAG